MSNVVYYIKEDIPILIVKLFPNKHITNEGWQWNSTVFSLVLRKKIPFRRIVHVFWNHRLLSLVIPSSCILAVVTVSVLKNIQNRLLSHEYTHILLKMQKQKQNSVFSFSPFLLAFFSLFFFFFFLMFPFLSCQYQAKWEPQFQSHSFTASQPFTTIVVPQCTYGNGVRRMTLGHALLDTGRRPSTNLSLSLFPKDLPGFKLSLL